MNRFMNTEAKEERWADQAESRIHNDVEQLFTALRNDSRSSDIVDLAVPDHFEFCVRVFSAVAQNRKDPQRIGEILSAMVTSYLELAAEHKESNRVYDPVDHEYYPEWDD